MQVFAKKMPKNLRISKKSSTFAPAFDEKVIYTALFREQS